MVVRRSDIDASVAELLAIYRVRGRQASHARQNFRQNTPTASEMKDDEHSRAEVPRELSYDVADGLNTAG
jgi:hypothetical protein